MSTPAPQHPPNRPDPLAVALAQLDPSPHGFNWHALMFAAGRESKARALLFWRVVAGACALVAAGLAAALVFRPAPQPTERIVYIDRFTPPPKGATPAVEHAPAPPWADSPAPEPGAAVRWFGVRNELLTVGLGALPPLGPSAPPPGEK
ncbi:hypothetical protein R5W23_001181 [Gemmata sp. JC673]|uniref:Uncharacterized protein n=1 Tax=Gemmata algarum TaxID=2975278 RepID=A0ABU5EZR6_9BACT|nr:hypothetical protein [Gemmata algarum]MDY3559982.1 hypothetical protein [Gemmata algarum]